ncbi:MAG TPA: hypothetical protein VGD72_05220, partial [Mycobacteriales bacterium]
MTLDASRALVAIAFGVVFAVWAGGDYGTQYFAGYLVEKSLYRHRDEDPDVEDNGMVRMARRVLPVATDYVDGGLVTRRGGRLAVTPLVIVLLAIG